MQKKSPFINVVKAEYKKGRTVYAVRPFRS